MLLVCGVAAIWAMARALGPLPSFLLLVLLQIIYTVITVRRLHDAGFSRWWVALCLFPMSITWDLFEIQVGTSTLQFVDFSNAIRSIPMLIGLIAKTQVRAADSVAHIFR